MSMAEMVMGCDGFNFLEGQLRQTVARDWPPVTFGGHMFGAEAGQHRLSGAHRGHASSRRCRLVVGRRSALQIFRKQVRFTEVRKL